MIGDDNHLYLTTSAIRNLVESLREIPELAEELAITRSGQARTGRRADYRMHRKAGEQPLPYNPAAAQVADHMHATLVGWVRLVCEQRGLAYSGPTATAGLARWLESNIIAFAMTEGVEAAPEEIARTVRAATSIISPPAPSVDIDPSMVQQARTHRLNASGIATLAKELGGDYRTLTVRRVQTLRDAGKITPVPGPWAPEWPEMFVVGEVLDQHLVHPRRPPRGGAVGRPGNGGGPGDVGLGMQVKPFVRQSWTPIAPAVVHDHRTGPHLDEDHRRGQAGGVPERQPAERYRQSDVSFVR